MPAEALAYSVKSTKWSLFFDNMLVVKSSIWQGVNLDFILKTNYKYYYPHKNIHIGVVLWHDVPDVPSYPRHILQCLKTTANDSLDDEQLSKSRTDGLKYRIQRGSRFVIKQDWAPVSS